MTPVTVAIPIFNGARFLSRTIESLLAQTHRDFTIVCLDDASTDESPAIARSFVSERLQVITHDVRRGLAGNWNAALEIASTPYLVIAHQDDVYEPRYLDTVTGLIEAHPTAFIAHTRAVYIDEHGREIGSTAGRFKDSFWPRDEPYERDPRVELRVLQRGNYIICPSAIFRMSAVARIGRFNEEYRFVPDWAYWLRGLLEGFTIAGTHQRLIRWRRHSESATVQEEATLRRYDEEIALLEWLSETSGLPRRRSIVENTLLTDFATRLARGDRVGAAALRRYARERLPEARFSHALMQLGTIGGPLAGRALKMAEAIYTRVARAPR